MKYTHNSDISKITAHLYRTKHATEPELCESLGKDLDSLYKIISEMRSIGYGMTFAKNLWSITHISKKLFPWELEHDLGTKIIGKRIEYHDSITSTQDYALELAKSENCNDCVIVSSVQNFGKGRHGRRWSSPNGGVWMSIIMKPDMVKNKIGVLPLAASCALCDAIRDVNNIKTLLVWPNDLVILRDGAAHKIAGMIVDAATSDNKIKWLVLGVGINFQIDEKALNDEICNESIVPAGSLFSQKHSASPIRTVQEFLRNLESICYSEDTSSSQIVSSWSKRSAIIGKKVSIKTANSRLFGTVSRIDDDGALVLNDGNTELRFVSGQVIRLSY